MSHYNVNAGVPENPDPAPDPVGDLLRPVRRRRSTEVLQSVLDTEITPELVPGGEDEEMQSSEAKVGPYALQDFSLFHMLRYGFRPSKVAFLAWHAWSDAEHGELAAGISARTSDRPTRSRRFGTGCRSSCSGSTRSASSSARHCRTAPRCPTAGRCRHAATGAPRRTCRRGPGSTRSSARFPRIKACPDPMISKAVAREQIRMVSQ